MYGTYNNVLHYRKNWEVVTLMKKDIHKYYEMLFYVLEKKLSEKN